MAFIRPGTIIDDIGQGKNLIVEMGPFEAEKNQIVKRLVSLLISNIQHIHKYMLI